MATHVTPAPGTRRLSQEAASAAARRKGFLRRHPVMRFVLSRLALAVPLLFIVSILTFIIVALIPGDPAVRLLGGNASPASYKAIDDKLGLNKPLPVQYWHWLSRLFHGDLGSSIFTHQSVMQQLDQRIGVTVALVIGAIVVATVVGVLLGTFAAYRRGVARAVTDVVTWLGFAIPAFWLGYLLVIWLALDAHLLPASGYVPFAQSPSKWLASLVLPVITLAVPGATSIAKQTRDAMTRVLESEYIASLRSDGIPERSIVFRHALRNGALPILTMIGLIFVGTLSSTVLVEKVFVMPGLGSLITDAASSHDLPVIEGVVLYFAAIVVVVNLTIDIVYGFLDPRVRVQ